MKYAVDCLLPGGTWRKGTILWPLADALIVAAAYHADHPDWLVEINPVDSTTL
jgi:hypothetical protein